MTNYNHLKRPTVELVNINGVTTPVGFNLESSHNPLESAANDQKFFDLNPDAGDLRRAFARAATPEMNPVQAMLKMVHMAANDRSLTHSQREKARVWMRQYHTFQRLGMGRLMKRSGHMEKGSQYLSTLSKQVRNKFDPEGKIRLALGMYNPENKVHRSARVYNKDFLNKAFRQSTVQATTRRTIGVSELNIPQEQPKPGMAKNLLQKAAKTATRRLLPVTAQLALEAVMPSAPRPNANRRRDPLLQLAA